MPQRHQSLRSKHRMVGEESQNRHDNGHNECTNWYFKILEHDTPTPLGSILYWTVNRAPGHTLTCSQPASSSINPRALHGLNLRQDGQVPGSAKYYTYLQLATVGRAGRGANGRKRSSKLDAQTGWAMRASLQKRWR